MSSFPSLASPEVAPVLDAIRARLERGGADKRGRMVLPDGVSPRACSILSDLVDRPVRRTIDLEALEMKLAKLGVGPDLPSALAELGHPLSEEPARRRAARWQATEAREAARAEVDSWGMDWGEEWISSIVSRGILAGLDPGASRRLVRASRRIVERVQATLEGPNQASRVDLAADLLGDAHALDWGTRESQAVTRALAILFGGDGRDAWERAGVNLDRVSAPVLSWGLTSSAGRLLSEALALGIPLHLSLLSLRRYPVAVAPGTDILVTENPRMVEAACERGTPYPVVALNGNPSSAARLLLDQLLSSGAVLRYHGDFDSAGIRICATMHRLGLVPWLMDSAAYLHAIAEAESSGAPLPVDQHRSPPTPWDPTLQEVFDQRRLIVHEERLIHSVLIAESP